MSVPLYFHGLPPASEIKTGTYALLLPWNIPNDAYHPVNHHPMSCVARHWSGLPAPRGPFSNPVQSQIKPLPSLTFRSMVADIRRMGNPCAFDKKWLGEPVSNKNV